MPSKKQIFKPCVQCGGVGSESGTDPISGDPVNTPCTNCGGTGDILLGSLSDDLVADFDQIKDDVNAIKDMVEQLLNQ